MLQCVVSSTVLPIAVTECRLTSCTSNGPASTVYTGGMITQYRYMYMSSMMLVCCNIPHTDLCVTKPLGAPPLSLSPSFSSLPLSLLSSSLVPSLPPLSLPLLSISLPPSLSPSLSSLPSSFLPGHLIHVCTCMLHTCINQYMYIYMYMCTCMYMLTQSTRQGKVKQLRPKTTSSFICLRRYVHVHVCTAMNI